MLSVQRAASYLLSLPQLDWIHFIKPIPYIHVIKQIHLIKALDGFRAEGGDKERSVPSLL